MIVVKTMKWYHKLGIGTGIGAMILAAAAGYYNTPRKPKFDETHFIELEKKMAELEKAKKELEDLMQSERNEEEAQKKEKSEKEKALLEYLETKLDLSEMSKTDYDFVLINEIAEADGLDFVKYLHDTLGLKTIEWYKVKINSKSYGVNCLDGLLNVCKDAKLKEKMYNPALQNFLNYWRSFPKFAEIDFSFDKMLEISKLPLEKINLKIIDEIFDSLGYEKNNVLHEDIADLSAIDLETVNQAKQKKCSINDLYLLDLIEKNPKIKEQHQNKELKTELEGRLSNLEHLFRTYKDENNKPDTNYIETPDLSQIDSFNQLRIKMFLDALQDKETLVQIKELISKDMADNNTEHGGVVIFDKDKLTFRNYNSRVRFDPLFNGQYAPSYNQYNIDGICTYHFHAAHEDNCKLAGPSEGDLNVSNKYKSTGIVITYLANEKINADFFYKTPDGKEIVVDLGTYKLN